MRSRMVTKHYFNVPGFFMRMKRWQIATLILLPLMVATTWGFVKTLPAVPPNNRQLRLNAVQINFYDQGPAATQTISPASVNDSPPTTPSKGIPPTDSPSAAASSTAVPS